MIRSFRAVVKGHAIRSPSAELRFVVRRTRDAPSGGVIVVVIVVTLPDQVPVEPSLKIPFRTKLPVAWLAATIACAAAALALLPAEEALV